MSATLEGLFRSPKSIRRANDSHEVWYLSSRPFTSCGLAYEKARPWTKRLSRQTLGGRVK